MISSQGKKFNFRKKNKNTNEEECGHALDKEYLDEMCLYATQRILDNE